MFTLRPASFDDAAFIRDLVNAARINPTGLDWQRFVVVVSSDGEIIGCGQVKPHKDGSSELASIVGAPAWRGNGVASAMIEHLVAADPGPLYLTCRSGLGPFYEKFGLRVVDQSEMTPYFRRLTRLVKAIGFVALGSEGMLVMLRNSGAGMGDP